MTQYATKSTSPWTEIHTKFSIKYKLGRVCTNLWKYLLTLGEEGKNIDFILNDFQKYIEKLQGKPHDFQWVKKQFKKLVFLRIIRIHKDYSHNSYRLLIRHPSAVNPKKPVEKNSQYLGFNPKKSPSNNSNSENSFNSSSLVKSTKNQASNTENNFSNNSDKISKTKSIDIQEYTRRQKMLQMCSDYGIRFNPKKSTTDNLYTYSLEELRLALNLYEVRGAKEIIYNPPGWLINCLKWRYWDDGELTQDDFITHMKEYFSSFNKSEDHFVF
ncbi:MAG: hypothetical protein ACFB2X_14925 [Rivularia sp. (in: cyanobacteria)]